MTTHSIDAVVMMRDLRETLSQQLLAVPPEERAGWTRRQIEGSALAGLLRPAVAEEAGTVLPASAAEDSRDSPSGSDHDQSLHRVVQWQARHNPPRQARGKEYTVESERYVWEKAYIAIITMCGEGSFEERLASATISALSRLQEPDVSGELKGDLETVLKWTRDNLQAGKLVRLPDERERDEFIEALLRLGSRCRRPS